MSTIGAAWNIAKKVDRLLELEEKHGKAIVGLQDQIDALSIRVVKLETREEVLMERAKAAAGMGAMAAMADVARRVGALEMHAQMSDRGQRDNEAPRLDGLTTD